MLRADIGYLYELKDGSTPIVCVGVSTANFANLIDEQVDILMVTSLLGKSIYAMDNVNETSLDTLIDHARGIVKATKSAMVVVDLPVMAMKSTEESFSAAARIIKESGASAIKIEGGSTVSPVVEFLVSRGIPVIAHIGVMPQYNRMLGDRKVIGGELRLNEIIMRDAYKLQEAGAFAIVLEGLQEDLADNLCKKLRLLTIGIGASKLCDAQMLSIEDILGINLKVNKSAKKYANLREEISRAIGYFSEDVRSKKFPYSDNLHK